MEILNNNHVPEIRQTNRSYPTSYQPISLLPLFSKLCEELILKCIYPIINNNKLIPNSQFWLERVTLQFTKFTDCRHPCSLKKKKYNGHSGLFLKLQSILSPSYYLFFKLYLNEKHFTVRSGSELSRVSPILAGVPQDAVASPTLNNLYTSEHPTHLDTQVALPSR